MSVTPSVIRFICFPVNVFFFPKTGSQEYTIILIMIMMIAITINFLLERKHDVSVRFLFQIRLRLLKSPRNAKSAQVKSHSFNRFPPSLGLYVFTHLVVELGGLFGGSLGQWPSPGALRPLCAQTSVFFPENHLDFAGCKLY